MACVYRYRDMWTNEIHYVGIVWSNTRKIDTRISEHYKNDQWCTDGCYIVETLDVPISSRTDAEYYEAHYISLYDTGKFYNKNKVGFGTSNIIPDNEDKWLYYGVSFPMQKSDKNKYDTIYQDIKNKCNIEKFDYYYIEIDSEDGYDAVIYKTKNRKDSYKDLYNVCKNYIPNNYGCFMIEPLKTAIDLTSKIFLGGISISEIEEDEFNYCDRFGDKLLSCCLDNIPNKNNVPNGVRIVNENLLQ